MPKPGDVVLVHFPFTDLAGAKQRPAVVVSPARFSTAHSDVVVLPLTSQPQLDPKLRIANWQASGLLKPTWVKPLIGTVSARLITKVLGQLDPADDVAVGYAILGLVEPRFL